MGAFLRATVREGPTGKLHQQATFYRQKFQIPSQLTCSDTRMAEVKSRAIQRQLTKNNMKSSGSTIVMMEGTSSP
eukprot:754970-Hanusia_phi.AAC.4